MIVVEGLRKRFRPPASLGSLLRLRLRGAPVTALDGVSLEVPAGGGLAVMGRNGAGKSTLLRILGGLLIPDEGRATVGGRVGYVPGEERGLMPLLSVREMLAFFGGLHGLDRQEALTRGAALVEQVGLVEVADRPLGQLSTGMRRRAALARGLIGNPEVLVLDEPTRGVDPRGTASLRQLIASLRRAGATLVLATHDVEEAREICDRVAVIDDGRLIALGSADEARRAIVEDADV